MQTIHIQSKRRPLMAKKKNLPPTQLIREEILRKVDMIHNSWGKKKNI